MNSPEISPETAQEQENSELQAETLPPAIDSSMEEYRKLQDELMKVTLILTGIIFISVWIFYSLNIALNYLLGACTGVVYLRMLARNVEQLGRERQKMGSARLALLVGVLIVATQLNQLKIMPIFLGFLTYKAAVIFYMLRTTILPDSN
ncbi:MAG: ATP synthase subunit I [Elainellaceae cyanobacterium]